MELSFEPLFAWLNAHFGTLLLICRSIAVAGLVYSALFLLSCIWSVPLRIRFGPIKLENVLKLFVGGIMLSWFVAAGYAVLFFAPLMVAKLLLINLLIVGSFGCLIIFLNTGRMNLALSQIQQECELATNLTFLQAEMTRAQLETLNERIRKSLQPEEREISETLLKSLSPLVMLYFKKEKNIMKWSMAAMTASKDLMGFFFSSKKTSG